MHSSNHIPDGWIETTLGDFTEKIGSGATPTGGAEAYKLSGISLIRSQNILNFMFSYKGLAFIDEIQAKKLKYVSVKSKDVLINITGDSVARVCMVPENTLPARVNQHVSILRVNPIKMDSYFLLYYLLNPHYQYYLLQLASSGATRNALTKIMLSGLQINLPPLQEQKAIAQVLTAFDHKIELLQAQNKTLETMAQTIFKEWFGKCQIGDELPEGWRVAKINEFVQSSIGGDYGKETIEGDYMEETICLRGTDLPDMKMGTPEKAPIRFLKASKLERCKLENGDIVVEISGGTENQSTGRAMYINEKILNNAKHPMTCVNFCRIIRPLKIEYSYFLHSLFDYLYTRKVFFNWENGTTGIKNLNLRALLEDFDLFIPQNTESILDFNKNVQAVFNKIQTNNAQVQSLTKTRDTLIPKLMSGQVRVNNIKQSADA